MIDMKRKLWLELREDITIFEQNGIFSFVEILNRDDLSHLWQNLTYQKYVTACDEDEMVDEVRAVCRAQNVLGAQTLICQIIASR